MKYIFAEDIQKRAEEISKILFPNVSIENIKCFRSFGSSSPYTLARCHGLNKIMQKALDRRAFYALEFLSEKFDKLPEEEKIKIIIHELMHIPNCFGGGFKNHNFVTKRNVDKHYREYIKKKYGN